MTFNTQAVYEDIKKRIHEGFYTPGVHLREAELASQYKVSRNTVKKSLLMLEGDQYLTIEPNKGAYVRSVSLEEVVQFMELRSVLEGFIAGKAAGGIDEAKIAELGEILKTMKMFMERGELVACSQQNQKFHEVIYSACPNLVAVDLVRKLKAQMQKYNTKTMLVPGRSVQSYNEHIEIFNALQMRDSEKAAQTMQLHMDNIRAVFQENFPLLFGWGDIPSPEPQERG